MIMPGKENGNGLMATSLLLLKKINLNNNWESKLNLSSTTLASSTQYCISDADTKLWIGPSTNFDNPRNWDHRQKPSSSETIVFNGSYNLPIEFPVGKMKACEVILPMNGEIIMPSNAIMSIGGEDGTSRCSGQGKVAEFASFMSSVGFLLPYFHFHYAEWWIKTDADCRCIVIHN